MFYSSTNPKGSSPLFSGGLDGDVVQVSPKEAGRQYVDEFRQQPAFTWAKETTGRGTAAMQAGGVGDSLGLLEVRRRVYTI